MKICCIKEQPFNYKASDITASQKKKSNAVLAVCGGAVLMPLIPLIDGDRFTSTIKNRNVAKYATGMAAAGGGLIASKLLYDRYVKSTDRTVYNTIAGACIVPLIMLADKWSTVSGKKLGGKWFAAGALAGGAAGFLCSKLNNKNGK